MESRDLYQELNEFQTPLVDLHIELEPEEVQEQFWDFFYSIPYIQHLVSKGRKRAKDLPRDSKGRIIVDITHPHILEDMDYFRPSALYFQQNQCYTKLRPNNNPNSEYGKWCKEEARRCREGYVRPSDGEWVTGDYYYFLNYAPMQLVKKDKKNGKKGKRVFDFARVWEGHYLKFHALNQARELGHHYAELASRSKGKAHPYSQIVYTPEGVKLWGNIKIGDKLFGDDGKVTTVIDIPFDEETKIYKVTLSDGRTLECSLGHLFNVRDCRKKVGEQLKTLSLEEIMNSDYYHLRKDGYYESYFSIPNNKGVDFNSKEILIDPYTLGLALGDGCFRAKYSNVLMFTSRDEDIKTYEKYVPYSMYKLESGKFDYRINIPHIKDYLIHYGLDNKGSSDKFIPDDYLFNTREVRLNVLRGLLDTDGTVNNNGIPMLTTTSERLCNDVILLCRSLGYNIRMFKKQGKYYDKKCKMTYNISILTNDPVFRLDRKLQLLTKFESTYSKSRRDWTHIVSIEYSHNEKAKCVTVDNKSHCYLIGDFITTHNSYSAAAMLAKRFVLGESEEVNKKVTCYITADDKKYLVNGDQTLDKFQYDIDWVAANMEWPSKKLFNSLSNMQWEMGYKDIDTGINKGTLNSVVGVTSKDDPAKLRGSRGVLYVLEEFGTFPALLDLVGNLRPSVEDGEDVYGLIMMYGCCCAGTKVWTGDGRNINIEELQSTDTIVGYGSGTNFTGDSVTTYSKGITIEPIGKLIQLGTKPCVEITFKSGNVLKCSTDHPVLIQKISHPRFSYNKNKRDTVYRDVFVKAENLKVGDTVCKCREISVFGKNTMFDSRFVGMLIGDGSYGLNNTPKYSSEDVELLNYVKSNYETGLSASHITKKGNIYEEIRVKGICAYLRELGIYGQTKTSKRLPANYQTLDKESTVLLLSGLYDTDGCVYIGRNNKTTDYIALTQGNAELLKQVQLLWKKFGVTSSITTCKPKISANRKDKKEWYNLVITGGENLTRASTVLKLLVTEKKQKLLLIKDRNSRDLLLKNKHYNRDYILDKVISIKSIGEQVIYNLSAGLSHTYLANDIITHNTSGDKDSDFSSAQELVNNPEGYNIISFENVWEKEGQGKRKFAFFFPGYINYANCYDEQNGVSDVTKALLTILKDRYKTKYNSSNPNAITKRIAEIPITPSEAMLKTGNNKFPVTQLTERVNQLDNNPSIYDDDYIGTLVQQPDGEVIFMPTSDEPIRDFPLKDNKAKGALEIFMMPQKDPETGKIYSNRYIGGFDPVDDDESETMSLVSMYILDLWEDKIVATWTGRLDFADDNFEMLRLLCLFYNARCLYENNKKGVFAYFKERRCLHLLAETPEYLFGKVIARGPGYGNTALGVNATAPVNNYANSLIRDWLLKPVITYTGEGDDMMEVSVPNLYFIKDRALLKELIAFNPFINVDRVRALGMLMLFRQSFIATFEGDPKRASSNDIDPINNDSYFSDYDTR